MKIIYDRSFIYTISDILAMTPTGQLTAANIGINELINHQVKKNETAWTYLCMFMITATKKQFTLLNYSDDTKLFFHI